MTEIVILAKNTSIGSVKTRLGKSIGMENAARVHESLVLHTVHTALESQIPVAVSLFENHPTALLHELLQLPVRLFPQCTGTLQQKIYQAMQQADRVIAVGVDCPLMTATDLQNAASVEGLIFGVAEDGGYWLVAANSPPQRMFAAIDWSSNRVLHQSLRNAKLLNHWPKLFPTRYDIDTLRDLQRLLFDPLCPPSIKKRFQVYA